MKIRVKKSTAAVFLLFAMMAALTIVCTVCR